MNRFLVIVVIILVPLAILTGKSDNSSVMYADTLERITLEVPLTIDEEFGSVEEKQESKPQVLISNNKDKSNPYTLDLEEYIIGVVAGEMPASFNLEALKAQAVAARTFALNKMNNISGYVLSTSINDQVYLTVAQMRSKWGNDFDYYYNRVKQAVEETKGEVVTSNGNLISAYYFAISNGATDDASVVFKENKSYLVSVDSRWDKSYASISSERTIPKNTFCAKLDLKKCDAITIQNVVRSQANYVREITINNQKFTGLEVFNKLGLKSTDFTFSVSKDNIVIKTLGFGHAVGMSQYGAQGMAKEGYTYQDILKHYYQNTEISNF